MIRVFRVNNSYLYEKYHPSMRNEFNMYKKTLISVLAIIGLTGLAVFGIRKFNEYLDDK